MMAASSVVQTAFPVSSKKYLRYEALSANTVIKKNPNTKYL